MPVEVIGHDRTRSELAAHRGSFALLGPEGVGRSRIVAEWVGERPSELLRKSDRAWVPDVVYIAGDDAPVRWEGLLRPLEEGRLILAAIATELPAPVMSRLPVFRVGLLSDFEVSRVLQLVNKMLQPRQLIAKLLGGSLARLDLAVRAAKTFETLDGALTAGDMTDIWRIDDFQAALFCFQSACSAVLVGSETPFKKDGLSRIGFAQALNVLDIEPHRLGQAEARNLLIRQLRQVCRG